MRSNGSNIVRRIIRASTKTEPTKPAESNIVRKIVSATTGAEAMQSNLSRGEQVLYNRETTTVTASWLEVEATTYAVRNLAKLTRYVVTPPRIEAGIVFIIAILLSIWQFLRISDEAPPMALNWFLLVLCLVLVLVSSFIVFYLQPTYRLDVTLSNEANPLKIVCETRADLDALNDALLVAMDYYRGKPEATAAVHRHVFDS